MKISKLLSLLGAMSLVMLSVQSCSSSVPFDFNPEIGVCTGLDNASMLAENGFDFIEAGVQGFLIPFATDEEFEAKLEAARNSPIPIKACNGFLPGRLKSVGPDAVHDQILAYAETAFRRAQMVGIEYIVFGSGASRSIPEGFDPAEARKQFIDLGKALGPVAAKYDVTIVLEPLNLKEVNFINTVMEGGAIVEEIDHPNFLLLADIYHMLMDEEGPESILKYGHLIKHVHVAEKEGRAAPGTHDEDLSAYYQALRDVRYRGRISIEGRWQDMEAQAAKAYETIKNQL
jgi:sugar phosphate isomerase/epimerase